MNTIEEIENYYQQCKQYWIRSGNSPRVSERKALWWDCVETWNFDNSWNDAKREFVRRHNIEPDSPIPDESKIERE